MTKEDRRYFLIAISVLTIALATWLITDTSLLDSIKGYTSNSIRVQQAREAVPVGTPREEAIAILGTDAWYYQPCYMYEGSRPIDLFFYGSHSYDKAEILIIDLRKNEEGAYLVRRISTFETNPWHTMFGDCVDRSRFD